MGEEEIERERESTQPSDITGSALNFLFPFHSLTV